MDLDEFTALVGTAWAPRAAAAPTRALLIGSLAAVRRVRSALDALEVEVTRQLASAGADAAAAVAEAGRVGLHEAERVVARAGTLDAFPAFASSFAEGKVSAAHLAALGQVVRSMEPAERPLLAERDGFLAGVAERGTAAELAKTVRAEAARRTASDGAARLARQRKATSLRTWVERDTGMWCGRFQFDPLTALHVDAAVNGRLAALFAEKVPDTCPSDPMAKQAHLRALALADLVLAPSAGADCGPADATAAADSGASSGRPGRRATVAASRRSVPRPRARTDVALVIDVDRVDDEGRPAPLVDVGLPVDLPVAALRQLCADAVINPILVRGGIVVGGVGRLNLGRTSRLANRAQRRALRVMYPTCAMPGCEAPYSCTKPHHVIWWRHGGRTDLDNLLPLCSRHHHNVHDDGWQVKLLPDRTLHVTLPDGTTLRAPPSRTRR